MGAHDGWHDGIDNFPGFRDWRQLCGASPASRFQCPGHGLNGRTGKPQVASGWMWGSILWLSGSGFCPSDLWTWFPDVMFLPKIFQSGITVASHVNPQDPPSINLGLLGWKLSLVWGGWAVPSWACDFLLICGLDWNKWIPELWIQNLSNGWDKFVQQLDCESWILVKYSQDVLECYFKDCFIAVAAAIEWLIPGWVEYLLPPIVRSWNGTQILSKCCLVFKVSSRALSIFLHQEMFTTMKCGWVRESSPNRTKTSAEFSGILTPKKECGSDKAWWEQIPIQRPQRSGKIDMLLEL